MTIYEQKYFFKPNDKRKYHIVDIIKDAKTSTELVIYKYYGLRKQYWHYQIEERWLVDESIRIGLYMNKRNSNG